MIERRIQSELEAALGYQAAVALIGPRQVGKTTLALTVAEGRKSLYLDLEDLADRDKLSDPRLFLEHFEDHLVILDEIHRMPELFPQLRGLIDRGRRTGRRTGRFLMLGSASLDVVQQAGESLAGRIAYLELNPLDMLEVEPTVAAVDRLWLRGGYPDSYLAADDSRSLRLRKDFIRAYLHRDVAFLNPRLPAETLERLWMMLAHGQGALLNQSRLATGLGIGASTVARYIDLLSDLMLVRRLQPVHANVGKRLVKSPKVYVRDSGLLHALIDVRDFNTLSGHPVAGGSWEGFVIETLLSITPAGTQAGFYRTAAGAEMDLVLDFADGVRWALEIKRSRPASLERGFHHARADLRPHRTFVITGGEDRYPIADGVEAIGLRQLVEALTLD